MEMLRNSLKSDRHTLLRLIQYDVLQKKPPFDSYKIFCKSFGDDVMDYPEFEFWYMRFWNEELDLDYDKSQDPKPLTFSDLPYDIVKKFVKKLGPVDRIIARHVSKSLRNCVDNKKPIASKVTMKILDDTVELKIDNHSVKFMKQESGCLFQENDGISFEIEKFGFVEAVFEELKKMFNKEKAPLNCLEIEIEKTEEFLKEFEKIDSSDSQFYVKLLKVTSDIPFGSLITTMKPGTLEEIKMCCTNPNPESFNIIWNSEQWKMAKKVELIEWGRLPAEQVKNFYHLGEFALEAEPLSRDVLIELKNNVPKSPTHLKWLLFTESTIDDVRAAFGKNVQEEVKFRIHPKISGYFGELRGERFIAIQREKRWFEILGF